MKRYHPMKPWTLGQLSHVVLLVFITMTVVLGGCATAPSFQPSVAPDEPGRAISSQDRELLRSASTIHLYHEPGLPFEFRLNAEGLLFMVGGIYFLPSTLTADQRNAQHVQREYRLEDPVQHLKRRFSEHLTTEMQPRGASVVDTPLSVPTPQGQGASPDGFAFVFQTTMWQVFRDPDAGFKRYRTAVGASARLVKVEEGRTLWQGRCQVTSGEASDIGELRAQNGRLLKLKLKEMAESCADRLWKHFLGPTATPGVP